MRISFMALDDSTAEYIPVDEYLSTETEDVVTAEDENIERLRSAYLETHANWWPGASPELDESLAALESAIWDYFAQTKVIFDAGRLKEAEKRCVMIWADVNTPRYCCVEAFRLAARCTLKHGWALEYLRLALETCQAECDITLYNDSEEMTVWVCNQRLNLIRHEIVEREAQQLAEDEG